MDSAVAKANLATIGAILTDAGVDWFLHAGTCLGAVREGDLLAHDYDTDIGLMPGQRVPFHELVSAGFVITYAECGVVHLVRAGERTDIFSFCADPGVFWHVCYTATEVLRYEFTPFALAPCDVLGFPAWVPDPVDRYLTENYGDWHTVVTEWDYQTDPCSITERSPRC
jgi:hypothetical protein